MGVEVSTPEGRRAAILEWLGGGNAAGVAERAGISVAELARWREGYFLSKLPPLAGEVRADVDRPVSIRRDDWGVAHVRAGRSFSFEVDAPDEGTARTTASELADRLLANPVIEESRLELEAL